MRTKTLGNTNLEVSVLGFGSSPLGDVFGPTSAGERQRAVDAAIDLGINFFDVAPYYGRTLAESRLGETLGSKRHKITLATKVGRYDIDSFDFSAGRVVRSVDESLQRLRTDYIDLIQAHDIEFGDRQQVIDETVPALRGLQKSGKVRHVGITGLQLKVLKAVAEAVPVDTILSYCRYNLLVSDLDDLLTPFVQDKRIGLINASPLHMGILTDGQPPDWHPAPPKVQEAGRQVAELCRSRGARAADVALRFCIEHPYVSTTLVGMCTQEQVEENMRGIEKEIDPDLLTGIREIVAPVANTIWASGRPENNDYDPSE